MHTLFSSVLVIVLRAGNEGAWGVRLEGVKANMPSGEHDTVRPWVLQVCHGYDGPFVDCVRQYATLFSGSRYRVCTVYLTGAPDDEITRGSASDEVIFLGYKSKAVRGLKLEAIRRLRKIAQGRDFELCIAHRFKPIYLCLLATRLPVVGVHHAFGVYRRPMRRWLINRFRSRLLLLGVSDAVRDEIRASLPAWNSACIETFYNHLDVEAVRSELVSRDEARSYLRLPKEAWVIGNVGRLHPDKDQRTLIQGFAEALPVLPAGSLLAIGGQGRLEDELKELVKKLGLGGRVYFLGQVKDARRYFQAFDVFALTSDREPFGMVLLEAMAAGVPVLSSDSGGAPEIVSGVGSLFPRHDSKALADCLLRLSQAAELEMVSVRQAMRDRLNTQFSDDVSRPLFFALLRSLGAKIGVA